MKKNKFSIFKVIKRFKKIIIINLFIFIYLINIYEVKFENKNFIPSTNNLTICMCSIAKKENN